MSSWPPKSNWADWSKPADWRKPSSPSERAAILQRRVDPEDAGNLPPQLLPLSRDLARLLRHQAPQRGLECRCDGGGGWARMADLLRLEDLRRWTEADVFQVVRESFSKDRPRFELAEDAESKVIWIRATHKHSLHKKGAQPPPPSGPPPGGPPPPSGPPLCCEQASSSSASSEPLAAIAVPPCPGPEAFSLVTPPGTPSRSARQFEEHEGDLTPDKLNPPIELSHLASRPSTEKSDVLPSLETTHWQRFLSDSAGVVASYWWWCAVDDDSFLEDAPAPWQKFVDSRTGRLWWYKDDDKWFFADTGKMQ